MKRTHYCGRIQNDHIGQTVTVCGWVQTKRDMGGVIFIDLKDREGILQTVFDLSYLNNNDFHIAEGLHNQSVIEVTGEIRLRDPQTFNAKISTGEIELVAKKVTLLSQADTLPFTLDHNVEIREDLRLQYRFLDLRRPQMFHNLSFRHQLLKTVRNYLDDHEFIEVETPILTKSTPEGARDYLVPSRIHPGTFYALPQSPQIFKQLLMVGGFDKYYQVARCFRDEDLRADRQPEFTQVDMELSFIEQEDILQHLEKLFKYIMKETKGIEIKEPFLRLTWQQAMDTYGSDKPDLRFDLPIVDLTDVAKKCSFTVFQSVAKKGGVVRAINVPGGEAFTHTQIEYLTAKALEYGAKGMAWIAIKPDGTPSSLLTKFFKPEELTEILQRVKANAGDFILFCADTKSVVRKTLGGLRSDLADMLQLKNKNEYKFLFVTDFPQFEYSEEQGRYLAMHHPFTMPYEEDIPYLISNPERVRAQAYDVVLNGVELGSGSIRIHRKDIQQKMFEALGFSDAQIEERFGFMVNAFKYGTPPHGGFAFGVDRLVMLLLGADSLREVIAFPKIKDASCPMTNAPSTVDEEQLEVLNLSAAFSQKEQIQLANQKQKKPTIAIENVADLACLSLTEKEKIALTAEMQSIIAFANQLSEIDTANVQVTAHIVPQKNVFRADKPSCNYTRDELLANAPTKENGYIYVPRVVE